MECKTYCVWLFGAFLGFQTTAGSAKECLLGSDSQVIRNEDGSVARDDDIYSVVNARASCGKKTSFLDTYKLDNNVISVPVGGATYKFLALALYDKTSAPRCNRIKVRSACFDPPAMHDGKMQIELYDRDTPSKQRVRFTLDRDGNPLERYPEYALVRAQFGVGRKRVFIPTRIRNGVSAFQEAARSCAGNPDSKLCLSNKEAVAEGVALERLRADRFIQIAEPAANQDKDKFKARFAGVAGMQAVIQDMMVRTELGRLSPYELSDATKGGSALSFGVRQLDIGGNDTAKEIFSDNLDDFAKNAAWNGRKEHKTFIYGASFQNPIRNYRVRQLFLMHDAMPTLQDLMRTPAAEVRLDDHHRDFLRKEAARYQQLRSRKCFQQSPLLALMAIDRRNQVPADYQKILDTVADRCRQETPVPAIEDEVAGMYGDYTSRPKKIRELIRDRNLN
jgi:hypothetical protein